MIIAGYSEDDASDELTNDPVFKAIFEKTALAYQPTVSRFFYRMDEVTLKQFQEISQILSRIPVALEEGIGRGTDEFHGKIRVTFLLIEFLPKRETGSLGVSQSTKPAHQASAVCGSSRV